MNIKSVFKSCAHTLVLAIALAFQWFAVFLGNVSYKLICFTDRKFK